MSDAEVERECFRISREIPNGLGLLLLEFEWTLQNGQFEDRTWERLMDELDRDSEELRAAEIAFDAVLDAMRGAPIWSGPNADELLRIRRRIHAAQLCLRGISLLIRVHAP